MSPLAARLVDFSPLGALVLGAALALRKLDDFDTWWHLASGRWIVEHRTIPHTDTFSYTVPDHAWVNLQWLYDIALYALYRIGGADLLVIAAAAAFTAALWLVIRSCRLFVSAPVAGVLGLFALLVTEERFMIRPEMVSFVLLTLLLWLLLGMRRDDGRKLWLLPVIFVLWVNCHSLFIIGLVCIAGFTAGALVARLWLPREWLRASDPGPLATRRLLLFGAASLAVTVLNPYFVEGALFPFELLSRLTGTGAFQAIGEFRPPFSGYFTTWSLGVFQAYYIASLVLLPIAALAGLARRRDTLTGTDAAARRGKETRLAPAMPVDATTPAPVEARAGLVTRLLAIVRADPGPRVEPGFDVGAALVFCAFAYLATLARRNTGLFAIGVTPIVAAWLGLIGARVGIVHALLRSRIAPAAHAGLAGALLVACVVLTWFVASNRYYSVSGVTKETGVGVLDMNFPIAAVEFMEQTRLPPKLYNDMTAGGYLTWRPGVEGGVFIDGRLEVYDAEFFSAYSAALNDLAAWQRDATRYGVSTVVLFHRWPNRHPLISFLARDPGWALVYFDEVAVVFVRREGNADAIARAAAAFPEWDKRTRERLLAAPSTWGVPVGRATALETYGRLLLTLNSRDRALEAWLRLLEIDGINDAEEANVRYRVAWLLAGRDERASARRQAAIAAQLAPKDENIKRLLQRLGQ